MNDRLGDLGNNTPAWATGRDDDDDGDIEANYSPSKSPSKPAPVDHDDFDWSEPVTPETAAPKVMDSFFKDVDDIKADIDAVKEATRRIAEINEEAVLATTSEKENELSSHLRPVVDDTNKRAKRTKNLLALLKEENVKLKKDGKVKASDLRIRENLCNTLTRKFIDEMKQYQNAQQKYKTDIKKKVTRQVQIVKPDATNEEIDMVMNNGGVDAVYKEKILAGGIADPIKTAYANVAGKYQDVITLEQSVAELHQMFLDFALLTEQQGELLDQIEFNVKSAADYIEDANVDVYQAIEYQKSIRKKQCWIIAIVVAVVVVILFSTGTLP